MKLYAIMDIKKVYSFLCVERASKEVMFYVSISTTAVTSQVENQKVGKSVKV